MQSEAQLTNTLAHYKTDRDTLGVQHDKLVAQVQLSQQNLHRLDGAIAALEAALAPCPD